MVGTRDGDDAESVQLLTLLDAQRKNTLNPVDSSLNKISPVKMILLIWLFKQ